MKNEFILENLACANCAAKMESSIKNLDGINSVNINFLNKRLIIEFEDNINIKDVTDKINTIVKDIEPDVELKEVSSTKSIQKIFTLKDLSCANCAAKMECAISKIEYVDNVNINFMNKELKLEINDITKSSEIINKIQNIVVSIEPDVKIIENNIENNKKTNENIDDNDRLKNKFIKLVISGIVFAIALLCEAFDISGLLVSMLFITSFLIAGYDTVLGAIKNIIKGKVFDEKFLVSLATIGAFIIGQHPEAVAVMLFYQVGELFQEYAVGKSRKSIANLMDIRPDYTNIKRGNDIIKVSPEEVSKGDIIVVKPGEKVPLDGVVIQGNSLLDTTALTGESVPREIMEGSEVLSGCINVSGMITVEVTKEFGESTVTKILDLVENASSKKATTENFITKFARYYTPVVVIIATFLAIIPPIFIDGATFVDWIYRALTFLVISCPCALVISVPLSFFGGIGGASKCGVLVKGSNYLEALAESEFVVFDKTGTLTKGVFNVNEIKAEGVSKNELLEIAAYAESHSNHPISVSLKKAYNKEIINSRITSQEEIAGHGVRATIDGKVVLVGNAKLMKKEDIKYFEGELVGTIVHIAVDNKYAGYIVISDEIKEDSKQAIKDLKALNIRKTVMLTGDAKSVGEKVANELGLDMAYTDLLPADKVDKVEMLLEKKSKNGKLVFVGDGINDAPVLARADVGIAMGGVGSDAAIEAADVVIMTDEVSKIATAIKVSKTTLKIVRQNIIFALGVKFTVLALGALGYTDMWEAVFADVGVSVIAVLNAMRAMNIKKYKN